MGKWTFVNGKTCICGREDKSLSSSYSPKYLLLNISFIDKTLYFVYYITSRSLYLQNLGEEEHNFADVNNIISELCGILERNMWRLR